MLRIAHFNMGQLSMGKKSKPLITKKDRSSIINQFENVFDIIAPDIIGFCEYAPYFSLKSDSTINTSDKTREAVLKNFKYFVSTKKEGMNCNAIASKKILLKDNKVVSYLNRKQKRTYIVANISLNGKQVKIVETHLDLPRFKELRDEQVKQILSAFEKDDYVIICGDFNVASVNEYDVFKKKGYQLVNHGSFGNATTLPKKNKGYSIDNIICKGFNIRSFQIYDTKLSDHYAISCDLEMK